MFAWELREHIDLHEYWLHRSALDMKTIEMKLQLFCSKLTDLSLYRKLSVAMQWEQVQNFTISIIQYLKWRHSVSKDFDYIQMDHVSLEIYKDSVISASTMNYVFLFERNSVTKFFI